jgi:para-nitrobenzyl esterase
VARALHSAQKQPVYRYLFTHTLDNDPQQKALGAVHTIEHAFFFPWQGQYRPTATDLQVQRLLIGRWTALARDGRLNRAGGMQWTAYTPANDAYLEIGATANMKSGPSNAQCEFWDGIPLPRPHL